MNEGASVGADWERAMGYRKFLKDYEIRREPQADGKVKKVRVYVGLYYRFTAAPEEVAQVRRRLPWLLPALAGAQIQSAFVLAGNVFLLIATFFAVLSGGVYLKQNWGLVAKEM